MRTKAREVVFQIVFASRFAEAERGMKNALYKKEKLALFTVKVTVLLAAL